MFACLSSRIMPSLLIVAALAWPARCEDSAAASILQRFIASQEQRDSWPVERIDIEASLPKWKKTGRLKAIRRIAQVGSPAYKIIETDGDPTIKHQVILRYISADAKAAEIPAPAIAITPANYKIHYVGTVSMGNRAAYCFRVIPRRKREGLINGAIWLDSETGVAVRESGYLAKSPSIFVRRIDLTREKNLEDGKVAARITYIKIETRLIGRAQLRIVERPSSDEEAEGGQ